MRRMRGIGSQTRHAASLNGSLYLITKKWNNSFADNILQEFSLVWNSEFHYS
jgi:hypothetical protein